MIRTKEVKMSTTSQAHEYLSQPYARVVVPDPDRGFAARIQEFPGCFAEGESLEEAYENLESAAEAWIQACLDTGVGVPPPAESHTHSGKVLLRLPKSLHRRAAEAAAADNTSLNQFLVAAVAERLGATRAPEQAALQGAVER